MESKTREEKVELCQRITKLAGHSLAKLLQLLRKAQPNALQFVDSQWVFNLDTLTDTTLFKLETFVDCCTRSTSSQDKVWRCPICGFPNSDAHSFCDICATDRPRNTPGAKTVNSKRQSKGNEVGKVARKLAHPNNQREGNERGRSVSSEQHRPLLTGSTASSNIAKNATFSSTYSPNKLSDHASSRVGYIDRSGPTNKPRHLGGDDGLAIFRHDASPRNHKGVETQNSNARAHLPNSLFSRRITNRKRNRSSSVMEQELAAVAMTELPNAFVRNSLNAQEGKTAPLGVPESQTAMSQPAGFYDPALATLNRMQSQLDLRADHLRGALESGEGTNPPFLERKRKHMSAAQGARKEPFSGQERPGAERIEIDGITVVRIGSPKPRNWRRKNRFSKPSEAVVGDSGLRWECSKCNKQFRMLSEIRVHVRIHTGDKPHQCGQCNARFSDPSNLRVHERGVHGGKTYHCDHEGCNAKYRYPASLRDHMRRHTGEMLSCSCGAKFLNKSNLNKHRRRKGCKTP